MDSLFRSDYAIKHLIEADTMSSGSLTFDADDTVSTGKSSHEAYVMSIDSTSYHHKTFYRLLVS